MYFVIMNKEEFSEVYTTISQLLISKDYAVAPTVVKNKLVSAMKVLDISSSSFQFTSDIALDSVYINMISEEIYINFILQDSNDLITLTSWYIVIYESDNVSEEEKSILKDLIRISCLTTDVNEFISLTMDDTTIDFNNVYTFDEFLESGIILLTNVKNKISIVSCTGKEAIGIYLTSWKEHK